MEFKSFTGLIDTEVGKRLGDGYKVKLDTVQKSNGIVLTGLTVIQDKNNISPTIYLNNYYERFTKGDVTLDGVVKDVIDTYNRNKVGHAVDMRYFLNYESVKQKIVYKLVNTERNKELLEDVPHMEYMDLSIVFQCLISQEELGTASILIHNVHMKLWDVTVEELFQAAEENTQKLLPYVIKPMQEVLCEIIQSEDDGEFDYEQCMEELEGSVPMFVLGNQSRVDGAACMMYPHLIEDFANAVDSDLYIIPSSVHELLLLPTENDTGDAEIKCMIREINDTQVSAEEVLSYSLYYYDREEGKIVRR